VRAARQRQQLQVIRYLANGLLAVVFLAACGGVENGGEADPRPVANNGGAPGAAHAPGCSPAYGVNPSEAPGPGAPAGDEPAQPEAATPAQPGGAPPDSLALALVVPEEVRPLEPVPIRLRVVNRTERSLELYLRGRTIAFDLMIAGPDDVLVWNRLYGEIVPAILRLEVLAAGATLELEHTWDQRSNTGAVVAPGTYTVCAELLTEGEPLRPQPASIRILPAAP
jgi:hypothetical protein